MRLTQNDKPFRFLDPLLIGLGITEGGGIHGANLTQVKTIIIELVLLSGEDVEFKTLLMTYINEREREKIQIHIQFKSYSTYCWESSSTKVAYRSFISIASRISMIFRNYQALIEIN
jgi:hypothetical protein